MPLRVVQPATGLLAASLFPLGHRRSLAARLIINSSINAGLELDGMVDVASDASSVATIGRQHAYQQGANVASGH